MGVTKSRKNPGFSASTTLGGWGSCWGRGSDSGPATDSQLRQRFPGLLLPAFSPGKGFPRLPLPFPRIFTINSSINTVKTAAPFIRIWRWLWLFHNTCYHHGMKVTCHKFFLHFAWICFGQVNVSCVCEEKTAAQDCICCIWCRYNICYTTLNCSNSDPDWVRKQTYNTKLQYFIFLWKPDGN